MRSTAAANRFVESEKIHLAPFECARAREDRANEHVL